MSRPAYRFTLFLLFLSVLPCCNARHTDELGVEMRRIDAPTGPAFKADDKLARPQSLQLAATNKSAAPAYMMSFVVDTSQRIFWLQPAAQPGAQSVVVPPTSTQPLMLGPVTLQDASPGPARVVTVFSERPLPAEGVNEQVRVGGYQAVRGIDGVTVVQSYPLVLE